MEIKLFTWNCGLCCFIILFRLFQMSLFIWDAAVLLTYNQCINCVDPIYTWLACVMALQILVFCLKFGLLTYCIRVICTIVAYAYGVEYHVSRALCSDADPGANAIYTLMVVHLITYTIEYVIVIVVIVIFAILVYSVGMTWYEAFCVIKKLKSGKTSINTINLFNITHDNNSGYEEL